MKDRVREAVFNLLGPGVAGTLALDLFAGTGALGIEALSRGAAWGVFLEKHFPTAELIRENLRSIGLGERAEVIGGDTFLQLRILRRDGRTFGSALTTTSGARPPWVVFCSPPYEFYITREAEMLQLLDDVTALAPPGSTLVVEADQRFDPTRLPEAEKWDVRKYPPAVVVWRKI